MSGAGGTTRGGATRGTARARQGTAGRAAGDPERNVATLRRWIAGVLRWGLRASAIVLATGAVLTFAQERHYVSGMSYRDVAGPSFTFPHTLAQLAHALAAGRGIGVLALGLLLLIATPVARVATSIVVFASQREWTYVVITSVVLTVLVLSFALVAEGV